MRRASQSGSKVAVELKQMEETTFHFGANDLRVQNRCCKLLTGLVMTLATFCFVMMAVLVSLATYFTLGAQDQNFTSSAFGDSLSWTLEQSELLK